MMLIMIIVLIILVLLLIVIGIISLINIKHIGIIIKKYNLNYLNDKEYQKVVGDILYHPIFLKLKNYTHHGNTSTYMHSVHVSYVAYLLSKEYQSPYLKSITRGALLHDFYLYDWHHAGEGHKFHGFRHARFAYINAQKYFNLDEIEKDIILKHMFPLTFYRFPLYKATWVITYVDKYVSVLETKKQI